MSGHVPGPRAPPVPVLTPMRLGFIARGDAAGGLRHHRHHADRPPAQRPAVVLFDRGEVGIEVDEQAAQGHGDECNELGSAVSRRSRLSRQRCLSINNLSRIWRFAADDHDVGRAPREQADADHARDLVERAFPAPTGSVIARPCTSRTQLPLSVVTPSRQTGWPPVMRHDLARDQAARHRDHLDRQREPAEHVDALGRIDDADELARWPAR